MFIKEPTVYLLDVLVPELEGHVGVLYGVRDPKWNCIVIASTKASEGLEPVAATRESTMLMALRSDGHGGFQYGLHKSAVTVLRWSTDYAARHEGLVATPDLASKTVAVIGLGSVGMPLALYLGRAGLNLVLVDGERVELANVIRSSVGLSHLDWWKTRVAAAQVAAANPRARVHTAQCSIEEALAHEPALLDGVDLVVNAASNEVGFLLAERFHRSLPVLFPGLHAGAASGELFVSLGTGHASDPCFSCYRGAPGLAPPTGRTWNYAAPGQELRAEPGLAPDINHVVAITTSVALNVLAGSTERVLEPDRRLLLVSNRRGALFEAAYTTQWVRVRRDPNCPNHEDATPVADVELERLAASVGRAEP